ncbi:hypothetical protein HYT74_03990 [Candidatus Daviesbacteria bacterium]|nr:hypothetical protein [Candidatus Daviesbacteria bacterium]MBI4038817.1 hypothetical protein [Candidatus Daviesbacteria bacterium]
MAKKVKSEDANIIPGGKLNNFLNNLSQGIINFKSSKKFYAVAAITALLILGIYKKSWFVAAIVNGTPITNLELQSKLNQQFRTQILNQLINEKIILEEARKGNAIPDQAEIEAKIAELEKNVGGKTSLDGLLTQQGQNRAILKDQILIQLAITKLYEKEATVSAEDVTKFIEANKDQMRASDSASQQTEAVDTLKQQKLSQIFSQKFQDLRQKAKTQIF